MRTRSALVAFLLASTIAAQLPTAPPSRVAGIVAVNLSPHARRDVATTVLPFRRGLYRGEPLSVSSTALQVEQLGAAWPDGSWRTARVHFPVSLGPDSVASLDVHMGSGQRPGFAWSEGVARGAGSLLIQIAVGQSVATFGPWTAIEDGHLVKAWRSRVRVPGTPVWAEMTLEVGSGLDHVRWWIWYGDSDPRDPGLEHDLGAIELRAMGAWPVVRFEESKVVSSAAGTVRLMGAQKWADGESQALTGVLIFPPAASGDWATVAAEQILPVLAVSDSWRESGTFGPWGYVPALPAGFDRAEARRRAVQEWNRYGRGDPWEEGLHGSSANPNKTGGQPDFGAAKLIDVASGYPECLFVVQRSTYQEACRPIWLRTAAVEPLDYLAQKPLPHVWGGMFWRTTPNLLGKTKPPGGYPPKVHGHFPRDRSHETVLHWSTYAMLTGDRLALAMLGAYTDLWLIREVTNSGNATIDGLPSPRGVGRTLDTGARLYLVTGRQDLAGSIRHRVAHTVNLFAGANTSPMRPLGVGKPDPRRLTNLPLAERMKLSTVTGWMEGLGMRGIDAVHLVLDSDAAGDLAYAVGKTLVEHCIWQRQDGRWVVADGVAWHGGAALTPAQIAAGHRQEAGGGSYGWMDWAYAGVVATRRQAVARGDQALADRCGSIIAQQLGLGADPAGWRAVR